MNQANAASGDLLNAEFYLFEDVGLGFDLSISQGFEVTERGDTIVLTDTQDNKDVLTVSPFQCSSTDSLKDCVSLQDKFEEYNNEKFTSSNGITFYNLTETNTRAAFNENSYGYYLNPSSSRDLINFADLMVFVDEKGIKEALEAQMGSLCKNIDHQLTSIYELRVAYGDDGKTEVTVE
ncbi:MAG: hypothetical protein H6765_11230 [Candidatus Peribacteria bacterium]|nr:MAG: hypothetical protein H6765_11230 [Candidatus Peribacteria bacterium]